MLLNPTHWAFKSKELGVLFSHQPPSRFNHFAVVDESYRLVLDALVAVGSERGWHRAVCWIHPLPFLRQLLEWPSGTGTPRLQSRLSSICRSPGPSPQDTTPLPGTVPGRPGCSMERTEIKNVDSRMATRLHLRDEQTIFSWPLTIQKPRQREGWGHGFWLGCCESPPQEKCGPVPDRVARRDR